MTGRPARHQQAARVRCVTPLGALWRGALAGAAGTAAMDLVQYLRYRSGGGKEGLVHYELVGVKGWEDAPAPAQVARRVVEAMGQRDLPDRSANLANNLVHWGYGIAWAAAFGVLAGSARSVRLWWGPAFGTAVFFSDYVVLPPTGLYQPISSYDAKTLAKDWGDHLLYGTTGGRRCCAPASPVIRVGRPPAREREVT